MLEKVLLQHSSHIEAKLINILCIENNFTAVLGIIEFFSSLAFLVVQMLLTKLLKQKDLTRTMKMAL